MESICRQIFICTKVYGEEISGTDWTRKGIGGMQESIEKVNGIVNKDALAEIACHELLTYGIWDGKARCKQWVKKYLLRRQIAPEDLIFWTTGLLAVGLWKYRQKLSAEISVQANVHAAESGTKTAQIDKALTAYYERWMRKGCPIAYLDDLLAGEVMLSACEEYSESGQSGDLINAQNADVYRDAVEKLAAYGLNYSTDETGSFLYRAAQNNGYIFVDSIGLACPFLYRYGVVFERENAVELAVKQIVNFLAYGMDGSTGLPYHGYVIQNACKYGIIGWGRAVGWLLRGMTGCMISEYGMERLTEPYVSLIDTVLAYQRGDGYFSWQLQAADGPADTSATGMICVALKQGMEFSILTEPKYEQALQAGIHAIGKSVRDGKVFDCSGECEGFGQYPQRYGAYPWALGPALML